MLQPVTWIDDWPMIGQDVDGDGIGEPILQHAKPIAGEPVAAPPSDDEFDRPRLGPQWEWNHNPRNSHWSLTERPGWLRLKASKLVVDGGFWGACNTLSQRIMGTGAGAATARLDLSGMSAGQSAGFVRFGGVYYLLGVRCSDDGSKRLFFDANGEMTDGPSIESDDLWIHTTNDGDQAEFSYSVDGEQFTRLGPTFTLKFGLWTGDRLGFFCWNDRESAGYLDVDFFHYTYDGPKAAAK
jgi:beta-xylosidase